MIENGQLDCRMSAFKSGEEVLVMCSGWLRLSNCESVKNRIQSLFIEATKTIYLYIGELREMGAKTMLATDDATEGFGGTVAGLFQRELDGGELGPIAKVYSCGPLPMMKAVAEDCAARGIPCEVSLETYMACGTGICLGCMVKTKDGDLIRTCKEGPIFDAATLDWE